MRSLALLGGLGILSLGSTAWAQEAVDANIGAIARRAITASGPVTAELQGDFAERIAEYIHAPNAHIIVTATAVGSLARPECKRIRVDLSAPGTFLPVAGGGRAPFRSTVMLNLCSDGTPPPGSGPEDAGSVIQTDPTQ